LAIAACRVVLRAALHISSRISTLTRAPTSFAASPPSDALPLLAIAVMESLMDAKPISLPRSPIVVSVDMIALLLLILFLTPPPTSAKPVFANLLLVQPVTSTAIWRLPMAVKSISVPTLGTAASVLSIVATSAFLTSKTTPDILAIQAYALFPIALMASITAIPTLLMVASRQLPAVQFLRIAASRMLPLILALAVFVVSRLVDARLTSKTATVRPRTDVRLISEALLLHAELALRCALLRMPSVLRVPIQFAASPPAILTLVIVIITPSMVARPTF